MVGVYTDGDILLNIVKDIIASDNLKDTSYHNLSVIVSFTRSVGEDLLGLHKARDEDKERQQTIEIDDNDKILTENQRESFINLLNNYFNSISQHLIQLQKELRTKERENHHILETKGELRYAKYTYIFMYIYIYMFSYNYDIIKWVYFLTPLYYSEAHSSAYDKLRNSFQKVVSNLTILSGILNKEMPELLEEEVIYSPTQMQ